MMKNLQKNLVAASLAQVVILHKAIEEDACGQSAKSCVPREKPKRTSNGL